MKIRISLITILVLIIVYLVSLFAYAEGSAENDYDKEYYAALFLQERGILKGDRGNLMLDDNLTREQMMIILSRIKGEEVKAIYSHWDSLGLEITFKDVSKDSWSRSYIEWAVANKITQGYNQEQFGPKDFLTGWQAMAFLVRTLGYNNIGDKEIEIKAKELGIDKNSNISLDLPITRKKMSLLVYNAINTTDINGEILGNTIGIFDLDKWDSLSKIKGSSVFISGDLIYYSIEGDGLYKSKLDGKEKMKICNGYIFSSIAVIDDWIYCGGSLASDYLQHSNDPTVRGLYKIKTDGTVKERISIFFPEGQLWIIGNWIYYIEGCSLYKVRTDGRCSFDLGPKYGVTKIDEGYIYYYLKFEPIVITLNKMNIYGASEMELSEDIYGWIEGISDEYIYYTNNDDSNKSYRIKFNGTENIKLNETLFNLFSNYLSCEYDGWIYFLESRFDSKYDFFKMKPDSNEITYICDNQKDLDPYDYTKTGSFDDLAPRFTKLVIIDEYIYYGILDNNKKEHLFRINIDGTNRVDLCCQQ